MLIKLHDIIWYHEVTVNLLWPSDAIWWHTLGWRALKTSTSETPDSEVTASIPLAQTPWSLTGRAWLQAGAQRVVIVVLPPLNSLRIDSHNGSMSTLDQVMVYYLVALSHYLNRCWLIISEVLWYSPGDNITGNAQDIYPWLIGPWEILINFQTSNFQVNFNDWWMRDLLWNCPPMNVTGPYWC